MRTHKITKPLYSTLPVKPLVCTSSFTKGFGLVNKLEREREGVIYRGWHLNPFGKEGGSGGGGGG